MSVVFFAIFYKFSIFDSGKFYIEWTEKNLDFAEIVIYRLETSRDMIFMTPGHLEGGFKCPKWRHLGI